MATTPAATPAAAPAPAVPRVCESGKWTSGMLEVGEDPIGALIGYCLPCVVYGQTAEKVHGGDMLYSCICACGLVAGPTRKAIRDAYQLPISPEFLKEQDRADCITYTIPCVNCFAVCQDAREVYYRNPAGPLKPEEFNWGVSTEAPSAAGAATTAPAQVEMAK
ncbi:hypothetical protein KSW81_001174 [Nannochloris sp. 'desiccata']|nr:hypothetical protein KSW81_001174 [Chlorella desiccata (nom. nud.)]